MRDYLIVGHGLAGALLSQELIKRGKSVQVIDADKENSASKVAAGIYNPLTGRKIVKTWIADELFPILPKFYKELENTLKVSFLNDIGMYRPFFTVEQQNDWNAKSLDGFENYISKISNQPHTNGKFKDPFGGIYLKNAGFVDIKVLLESHKNFLVDKGCYQKKVFHESKLSIEDNFISYDNIAFKRLVFCLGIGQHLSPYFDWLPFRLVKGEILDCKLNLDINTIVNRGVFIVPKGNGEYRVGATYNTNNLNDETTQSGRLELVEKMEVLFSGDYEVIGAKAGIRPASKDRRPFIGKHPKFENLYVFNGFGSKGVSMIPHFSKMFADCLDSGETIKKEVSINRYLSSNYTK